MYSLQFILDASYGKGIEEYSHSILDYNCKSLYKK